VSGGQGRVTEGPEDWLGRGTCDELCVSMWSRRMRPIQIILLVWGGADNSLQVFSDPCRPEAGSALPPSASSLPHALGPWTGG
jgi:hypothetical protein